MTAWKSRERSRERAYRLNLLSLREVLFFTFLFFFYLKGIDKKRKKKEEVVYLFVRVGKLGCWEV
jgi:hypothetical protein